MCRTRKEIRIRRRITVVQRKEEEGRGGGAIPLGPWPCVGAVWVTFDCRPSHAKVQLDGRQIPAFAFLTPREAFDTHTHTHPVSSRYWINNHAILFCLLHIYTLRCFRCLPFLFLPLLVWPMARRRVVVISSHALLAPSNTQRTAYRRVSWCQLETRTRATLGHRTDYRLDWLSLKSDMQLH